MERTPILKKSRLQRIGLFAIATFFVFTGSLQAEPIAGKPPLTVVSFGITGNLSKFSCWMNSECCETSLNLPIGHTYRGTANGLFDFRRCIGKTRLVRPTMAWFLVGLLGAIRKIS